MKRIGNSPPCKVPRLEQYTAKGWSSSPPSVRTANLTKIRSFISPRQSNGKHALSCHTGLNPLFFTTPVLYDSARVALTAFPTLVVALVGEEYAVAPTEVLLTAAAGGTKGECVQSGTWIETSTYGSMMDFVTISRPSESRGLGSCCAEIICVNGRSDDSGLVGDKVWYGQ